ncbi:hypothetical protein [Ramlibacter tataouinensis]|uniref:Candidate membrane protein n=1 Tax=Ramlibacter tataouinensis (strain ATCC BAA-407 / DSM 14655 / LMG 21543 / TTB310) TaxID=365046 RepID=F5Y4T4_RAMTT|nr:hypothetical protein [Ramlibacter tataouinensis]AEG92590.1 candidate membrane protein [Ramlibacter tataouinensis TTB310]
MNWNDLAGDSPGALAQLIDRLGSPSMLTEAGLALVITILALAAPRLGGVFFGRIEQAAAPLLARPWRAILFVGLLAVAARAVFLPWLGPPSAAVHDEQSLLLQAQTYLQGRLANPTHPFWEHFETFHVNQVPAYASMYFPGRSAPLAAGLLVAGEPWVGVWLSFVLMCMAAVWMLQAWVPAPFALLGGVLLVIRFGVFSYWVNSYWGGAFTALGAMLVIGALPRILRRPSWALGGTIGLGAAILMTTRSYEGMLLCIPVAVLLLARLLRPSWAGGRWQLLKTVVPATALVGAGGALLLAYNVATTGHALLTPYEVNRAAYAAAPAFLTSPPLQSQLRGPAYFRDFYRAEGRDYQRRYSTAGIGAGIAGKLFHNWNFYVGPLFTFALLAGLGAVRREGFLLGTLGFFMLGYALVTWNFPHYTAPLLPVLLIIVMRGFMYLRGWQLRGRPVGLFLTRAMPAAAVATLLLPAAAVVFGVPRLNAEFTAQACCAIGQEGLRNRLIARLKNEPGRDLVLVKVGPHTPLHYEMVYNEPDIDRAEVVIARSLGDTRDRALLQHFADRRIWQFDWRPDLPEAYTLVPLSPQAIAAAPR